MSTIDKILDVIEGHDHQSSTELALYVTGLCWKCAIATADDAGLCAPCRDQLLDEAYTAPPPRTDRLAELLELVPDPQRRTR